MATFSARNRSSATLSASVEEVWAALTDPDLIAEFTPYLERIEVEGDRWRWHMAGIPVPGADFSPSFTEVMEFDEPHRITYRHDPTRPEEKAAVEGVYDLATTASGGTYVSIDLTISVDLPLPGAMHRIVEGAMDVVIAQIGKTFAANLTRHLGESD